MKKRILIAGLGFLAVCLMIGLGIAVIRIRNQGTGIGKNNNAAVDTSGEKIEDTIKQDGESTTDQNKGDTDANSSGVSGQESTEKTDAIKFTEPIEKQGTILEILDFEYVDKLEDYDGYKDKFMYYQAIPKSGTDIMIEQDIDYEAVYQEAPKYEDTQKNPDKYTIDEEIEILQNTQDIIDKYTYDKEVPYDYLFVHCRLTNIQNKKIEAAINDMQLHNVKNGEWITHASYEMTYFDKTQRDNTDTHYFFYDMKPKEVLEYTVAFSIAEEKSQGVYYCGVPDVIVDAEENMQNPAVQFMYMRKLMKR